VRFEIVKKAKKIKFTPEIVAKFYSIIYVSNLLYTDSGNSALFFLLSGMHSTSVEHQT